jgi:hypothetical protein
MSNERTDEFLRWRGLLDQPDARPDLALDDREATWQKLADRLGERRRNRLSGYRLAAACLLLLALVPAFRFARGRHEKPLAIRSAYRQVISPAAASSSLETINPVVSGRETAKTRAAGSRLLKAPSRRQLTPGGSLPTAPPAASDSLKAPAGLPEMPPLTLSSVFAPTIPAAKKERKVVNINELNSSLARPHGTAANRNPGFLRIGPGDPAVPGDESQLRRLDETPGLKIRLTPQN